MYKAFKYRLYPTGEQIVLLNKHFGCCRFVYNYALNMRISEYETEKKDISRYDLCGEITKLKKREDASWLKEVNSQSLQYSLVCLDSAYKKFFKEKKGFPKYKSKHSSKQSFTVPQNVSVDFVNGLLYIPKFKEGIKCVFSRTFEGRICSCTVSRNASGRLFVSILVDTGEVLPPKPVVCESKAIGIDLGIKTFAVCSNGEEIHNPKFLRKSEKRLAHLQRNFSRTKKGSNRHEKARLALARQYEKVSNRREDFLHKVSTALIKDERFDTICLESLNISGMVKNHHLAKSINDCNWGKFVSMLQYKADWYGKNILKIGQFDPSSKMCSCGYINKELTLRDRVWVCPECGATNNRDFLASKNILKFAFHPLNKEVVGRGTTESTLVESSSELKEARISQRKCHRKSL